MPNKKIVTAIVLSTAVAAATVAVGSNHPVPAPNTAYAAMSFPDVSKDFWGYSVIQWAANNGVVAGYPDGTFKPDNNVTEAEFLTMLVKAYHPQLPQVEVHQWADPVYAFSKTMNYPLNGYDNIPARDWVITRQHVAEIMAGASGVNYSGRDAIQYVLAKGLAKGEDPAHISIEIFNGQGLLTRAEAVAFIQNAMQHGLKQLLPRPAQPSDPSQLPPLPGQQQQPTQPQPPVQPPSQPTDQNGQNPVNDLLKQLVDRLNKSVKPSDLPHVDMNNWTPGDSTVLGKALFSNNFKFNNDGGATLTIPTTEQLGQPQGAGIFDQYIFPKGSPEGYKNLEPGRTYTLAPGTGAHVFVSLLDAQGKVQELYDVALDGSGRVGTLKRVNGQQVHDITSFAALARGLGVQ